MPRFYFHLLNDIDAPDDEGVELPDMEAARAHAVRQARVTFAETAKDQGKVVLHHRIDIENEEGAVLDTVHFGDAVTVQP
jgi:nitrous oxidase accessory protein NosD